MVSNPIAGASRKSAVSAFRAVCGFWLGMSIVYLVGYLHVAVLGGRYGQGLLLASLPILQAIWISAYVWLKEFRSETEAMIRSAAGAAALAGISEGLFLLTARFFGGFRSSWDSDRLQLSYVLTVLLLSGLAGGTALGILRWRVLQGQQRLQATARISDSWWGNYLRSAVLWIASATVFAWLTEWLCLHLFSSSQGNFPYWGILFVLFGAAGLLLIAPIPVVSPPLTDTDRRKLTWKYSKFAALVLVAIWGFLVMIGISARNFFVVFVIEAAPYLFLLWVACFFWAFLYGWSAQFPAAASLSEHAPVSRRPARVAELTIISFTALGQIGALLAGLLATAPVSLGVHGIGCLNVYSSMPSEYWFWQGYKGISSEVTIENRIVFRPAADSSACVSTPTQGMNDPPSVEVGYLSAARAWFWLIDPEQWASDRTSQFRREIARLLGRDFSSYDELRSWWEQNSGSLVWSAQDQLLEVHKVDQWGLASPYTYHQQHPGARRSVVEQVRERGPQWFGASGPDPVPSATGRDFDDQFLSPAFDLEARLRGLKLYLADSMEVLTGERQRRTREFLRNITERDFATENEWQNALDQIRSTNPWQMSLFEAQDWVSLIRKNRNTIREAGTLAGLQKKTGLNYASLEDFVPWLENPENTRAQDWEKASAMINDLCLDDRGYQYHCPLRTLATLKELTGKTFDSTKEWVRWWQDNRANLVLSEDGRRLVTKSK